MKRPRRFFKSWLGRDIKVYLALKRAMGRKYLGEESTLRYLDRFVAQRFPFAKDLSVSILEAWIAAAGFSPTVERRISSVFASSASTASARARMRSCRTAISIGLSGRIMFPGVFRSF